MNLLNYGQIAIAIALMAVILMQNRGGGLSGVFGGTGGGAYQTKRGFEKKLYYATIVLAVVFFIVSIASVILV